MSNIISFETIYDFLIIKYNIKFNANFKINEDKPLNAQGHFNFCQKPLKTASSIGFIQKKRKKYFLRI